MLKLFAVTVVLLASPLLANELRIVNWNTAGEARDGTSTVLEAIGLETVNDISRPIDVLSLQEQNTSGSDTRSILALFDTLYGDGVYAAAPKPSNATSSGAGLPGLIFNTQTIDLVSAVAFGEVNTSAQARSTLRFELQPDGFGDDAKFFVYSNHYKASTGTSNEARRNGEAIALRADLDSLGDGVAAILTGDFNIRSSSEAMYQTLLGDGPGQVFDPINTPGRWHDAQKFKSVHTQSPATVKAFPSQVAAGLDDRFDFQLVTVELLDGVGLDYVPNSYRAFGNNGPHILNESITTGSGASVAVLEALSTASDHLPIVLDLYLPVAWDCDGNRVVSVLDANCTSAEDLSEFLTSNGLLLGDLDEDGTVGFSDFLLLSSNFGQEGEYTSGDLDKNGVVQFADFLTLSQNISGNVQPVPESHVGLLSVIVFLAFLRRT